MKENKKIKLVKYIKVLQNKNILIGECIDWYKLGNKQKREELKNLGIEITIIKRNYLNYFFKDLSFFKGNVIIITFKNKISNNEIKNLLNDLEMEMGILLLFIIIDGRILSVNYLKEILKEPIYKESISSLLINDLKNKINQLMLLNKNIIKIISKIK